MPTQQNYDPRNNQPYQRDRQLRNFGSSGRMGGGGAGYTGGGGSVGRPAQTHSGGFNFPQMGMGWQADTYGAGTTGAYGPAGFGGNQQFGYAGGGGRPVGGPGYGIAGTGNPFGGAPFGTFSGGGGGGYGLGGYPGGGGGFGGGGFGGGGFGGGGFGGGGFGGGGQHDQLARNIHEGTLYNEGLYGGGGGGYGGPYGGGGGGGGPYGGGGGPYGGGQQGGYPGSGGLGHNGTPTGAPPQGPGRNIFTGALPGGMPRQQMGPYGGMDGWGADPTSTSQGSSSGGRMVNITNPLTGSQGNGQRWMPPTSQPNPPAAADTGSDVGPLQGASSNASSIQRLIDMFGGLLGGGGSAMNDQAPSTSQGGSERQTVQVQPPRKLDQLHPAASGGGRPQTQMGVDQQAREIRQPPVVGRDDWTRQLGDFPSDQRQVPQTQRGGISASNHRPDGSFTISGGSLGHPASDGGLTVSADGTVTGGWGIPVDPSTLSPEIQQLINGGGQQPSQGGAPAGGIKPASMGMWAPLPEGQSPPPGYGSGPGNPGGLNQYMDWFNSQQPGMGGGQQQPNQGMQKPGFGGGQFDMIDGNPNLTSQLGNQQPGQQMTRPPGPFGTGQDQYGQKPGQQMDGRYHPQQQQPGGGPGGQQMTRPPGPFGTGQDQYGQKPGQQMDGRYHPQQQQPGGGQQMPPGQGRRGYHGGDTGWRPQQQQPGGGQQPGQQMPQPAYGPGTSEEYMRQNTDTPWMGAGGTSMPQAESPSALQRQQPPQRQRPPQAEPPRWEDYTRPGTYTGPAGNPAIGGLREWGGPGPEPQPQRPPTGSLGQPDETKYGSVVINGVEGYWTRPRPQVGNERPQAQFVAGPNPYEKGSAGNPYDPAHQQGFDEWFSKPENRKGWGQLDGRGIASARRHYEEMLAQQGGPQQQQNQGNVSNDMMNADGTPFNPNSSVGPPGRPGGPQQQQNQGNVSNDMMMGDGTPYRPNSSVGPPGRPNAWEQQTTRPLTGGGSQGPGAGPTGSGTYYDPDRGYFLGEDASGPEMSFGGRGFNEKDAADLDRYRRGGGVPWGPEDPRTVAQIEMNEWRAKRGLPPEAVGRPGGGMQGPGGTSMPQADPGTSIPQPGGPQGPQSDGDVNFGIGPRGLPVRIPQPGGPWPWGKGLQIA